MSSYYVTLKKKQKTQCYTTSKQLTFHSTQTLTSMVNTPVIYTNTLDFFP